MKRMLVFIYGLVCYGSFLLTFLYLIGFVGDIFVPKTIDSVPSVSPAEAIPVNLLLLTIFGLQHTIMARPAFKRWWTMLVPSAIERSTYVLISNLVLVLLFWQWRPMGYVIWDVQQPFGWVVLQSMFIFGWLLVLVATALINHLDLFGLRQVWLYLRRRRYFTSLFVTPGPYKIIRHPLYLGWMIAFWATPKMTAGHLLFAVATTVYMLIAIYFEERNLIAEHGRKYREYRERIPMLVPFARGLQPRAKPSDEGSTGDGAGHRKSA
jgi:protein-S-isoprenylcysteine O-methyltransferase Ste14